MSTEEMNKAVVRRYIEEVINNQRHDLIDELFAPELAAEVRGHISGPDPFPDGREEIVDLVAEGNTVIARWNMRGTHQADYLGIPATGKPVELIGFAVYYLENGRIVDDLILMSNYGFLRQVEATIIPPP
jgi:predicted ester cyclase